MSSKVLQGRCLCGSVRYQCESSTTHACYCHCESCRRASGAHIVAWLTVPRETFRVISGTLREYASSPPVLRQFCERCGSPLTYWNKNTVDTIDVTVGTLDRPELIEFTDHIWMEDAPPWDRPRDGLPQFRTSRAAGLRFDT